MIQKLLFFKICLYSKTFLFQSQKQLFVRVFVKLRKAWFTCKNQRKSSFLESNNSLENICFWVSKTAVFESQNNFKERLLSHFLITFELLLSLQNSSGKLKRPKKPTQVKLLWVSKTVSKRIVFEFQKELFVESQKSLMYDGFYRVLSFHEEFQH